MPNDWHKGIILPVWKGKGDCQDCSNYRDIMLFSIPGRPFTHICLNQAVMFIHGGHHPQQPVSCQITQPMTTFQISNWWLRSFCEFQKDHHLYIAFMDLKAAFDLVDHRVLWHILKTTGVPQRIINILAKLHNGTENCLWESCKDCD